MSGFMIRPTEQHLHAPAAGLLLTLTRVIEWRRMCNINSFISYTSVNGFTNDIKWEMAFFYTSAPALKWWEHRECQDERTGESWLASRRLGREHTYRKLHFLFFLSLFLSVCVY